MELMASQTGSYERLRERYEKGDVPWDEELPPPEVLDLGSQLPPGRALDLGCGYGRAAIFLARAGWRVDAVDFVELALDEAQRRAEAAGVADAITYHQSTVTDLHFLDGPYDLALDVGCGHSLDEQGLQAYRDELLRLLGPDALFLFFARVKEQADHDDEGPRGLAESLFLDLFSNGFRLVKREAGFTDMGDSGWSSSWYWLRRSPL